MLYGPAALLLQVRHSTASVSLLNSKNMTIGTITAHHLYLTGDDSEVDPHAFCKPIPKTPLDRDALIRAVGSGDAKFFL